MAIPKYLEAFRRAARETENREKSEVSEKRGGGEGLNSLTSLISPPEPSQNSVESDAAVCAVCGAANDLWQFGDALVHQECAAFLPKPESVEPTAVAYQAASPDCSVTVI